MSRPLRRLLIPGLVALPLAGALAPVAPAAAAAPGGLTAAAPHIFWTRSGAPGSARTPATSTAPTGSQVNNLIYHGGAVLHHPHVYITFYGSQWDGLTDTSPQGVTYTAAQIEAYETSFFSSIGGTAWHGTQSQYCDGISTGAQDCSGATDPSQFVTNESNLLAGVWVDDATAAPTEIATTGLAQNIATDPVATEAVRAAAHFTSNLPGGFDEDGVYFVFTPPQTAATAYGSVYCAYHSEVTNTANPGQHGIKYAFMPYTPSQGAGCGGNSVNFTDDAFGHGYLDSYSLAGGHEFEEAVTDPDAFPTQDGWNDFQTDENGDKCAYFATANLTVGSQFWAVQPLWSNEANGGDGGCAMSRGTGPAPFPSAPNAIVPPSTLPEAPVAPLLPLLPLAVGTAVAVWRRRGSPGVAA